MIEIELTGDGPLAPVEAPGDPDRLPPNWRRLVGIALIAGTALGVTGALVLSTLEQDDPAATTTLPPDEIGSAITTPPTLRPLDTLPPADFAATEATEPPWDDLRPPISAPVEPLLALPSYPAVEEPAVSVAIPDTIEPAVAALADDVARRSRTHVELGIDGYALDVVIERDPVLDRYRVVFEFGADRQQVAIIDAAAGITHVDPGTPDYATILNEDIVAGSDAADIHEFVDDLLLGPVRPDTISLPVTTAGDVYDLGGAGLARQFMTRVAGEDVPEWQIYTFSPVFEFRPEDRPQMLDYLVYVDARGDIIQVDGVAQVGDVGQLISHSLERLDESFRIDLPDPPAPSTVPTPTVPTSTVNGG